MCLRTTWDFHSYSTSVAPQWLKSTITCQLCSFSESYSIGWKNACILYHWISSRSSPPSPLDHHCIPLLQYPSPGWWCHPQSVSGWLHRQRSEHTLVHTGVYEVAFWMWLLLRSILKNPPEKKTKTEQLLENRTDQVWKLRTLDIPIWYLLKNSCTPWLSNVGHLFDMK